MHNRDAVQHHFKSEKFMFIAQYFETKDACQARLNRRFDAKSYALLQKLVNVFLCAANWKAFKFNDALRRTYGNRIDFDQAIAEMKLLPSLLHDVKRVTSPDNVFFSVNQWPKWRTALASVVRLTQIYLLAPMSAAPAERSVSCSKTTDKKSSQNTMSEEIHYNLLMLNIVKKRTDNILTKPAREFANENDRRLRFFGKC